MRTQWLKLPRLIAVGFLAIIMGVLIGDCVDSVRHSLQHQDVPLDRKGLAEMIAATDDHLESEISCLAEAFYYEGRGEFEGPLRVLGMIIIARTRDPDPQWPKTICRVVAQDGQFAYRKDGKVLSRSIVIADWDRVNRIAHELYREAWSTQLLPRGWECARWYMRADGKDVSKKGRTFFETRLSPIASFGHHTAYKDRRGCSNPLPTT